MSFDRSQIPKPNQEVKFSLPEIKRFTLSNGLKILFVQRNYLPTLRMSLIVNCGSVFDPKEKSGLANLFTLSIDEGAGDYNSLELSEEFEILGSSFSASCNHDNVFLSVRTLTENFERSLKLFSLILTKPHFNDADFQREKRKVEVKLLQQKDDPEELAELAFENVIHGKSNAYAFPILGFDESISKLSIDEVKSFYENYFNPLSAQLVVAGAITEEELSSLLEKHLIIWKNTPRLFNPQFDNAKNKRTVYILHKEGAVQTEIRVGHQSTRRNASDYFPKTIMNMILGGQFSSRINLNLREAKGFTYGATSNFSYHKNAGEFCVSTSVSTENTRAAVNEILIELEKIKQGVTDKELDFTKSSMTRRFPSNFEADGQVISNLSLLAIHGLPLNYFDSYVDNILNISIDEVQKAAVDNIKLNELSIVLVGDKNKLLNEFLTSEFGEVKIVNHNGEVVN